MRCSWTTCSIGSRARRLRISLIGITVRWIRGGDRLTWKILWRVLGIGGAEALVLDVVDRDVEEPVEQTAPARSPAAFVSDARSPASWGVLRAMRIGLPRTGFTVCV